MAKNVTELKREYSKVKFDLREPVLDIGGGDGSFLKSQGVKNATIIDGTTVRLYGYRYVNADITKKLPNFKNKFNTIFIMETLEHLKNPLYVLAQAYDLLTDNGKCYIAVPYTPIGDNLQHVCRWKLKELTNQVNKIGFAAKVLEKRRRFKNLAFFLPHCWIVLELTKIKLDTNKINISEFKLKFNKSK